MPLGRVGILLKVHEVVVSRDGTHMMKRMCFTIFRMPTLACAVQLAGGERRKHISVTPIAVQSCWPAS